MPFIAQVCGAGSIIWPARGLLFAMSAGVDGNAQVMQAAQAHVEVPGITASVVSHGHGEQVQALLHQLAALKGLRPQRVILTLNQPEPQLAGAVAQDRERFPFELVLLENAHPQGFGRNHNRAFAHDLAHPWPGPVAALPRLFAVINPDIRLHGNPFPALCSALLSAPFNGLAYPQQVGAQGQAQDHARRVPTPARLWHRYARRLVGEAAGQALAPNESPDWVNAAFLLVRQSAWQTVGGFDERFHMYCEDVDFCLRLQLAHWRLVGAPDAVVEHAAQRASHRQLRHLAWHVVSLVRLWRSDAYRQYLGHGPV